MAFVCFDSRFQLGHPEIDAQHAGLFEAVNQLHDALMEGRARQELTATLAFLAAYTVSHFQTEEQLMEAFAYPATAEHRAEHAALVKQVQDLTERHQTGNMTISITVLQFLKHWLEVHISDHDRRLVAALKASARAKGNPLHESP